MKKCGRCGGTVRGAKTAGGPNDPGVNSSQQNAIDQSNQLRADGYARGGPSNIMRSTCPPESAALRYLWGQMRSQKFPAGAVVAGTDPNNPNFVPDPPSDGDQFVPPDLVMQHNQGCGSMPLDDIKEYFRSGKDSCGGPHGRDYGAAYTLPDVYMQDNQGPGYMPPDDIRDYYKTGYQICKCDAPVVAEADIAAQVGSWMGGYGARTAHIHARAGKTYHHPKAYEVLFAIGAPHAAAQHERGEGYGHWPVKAVKEHIEEEESKLFPLLLHVADTLPVIESLELRHNVMKLINEHTEVKAKYLSHGNEIPPELAIPHGKLEDELISQYADRILVIFHAIKGARVSGARVGKDWNVRDTVDVTEELATIHSMPAIPKVKDLPESIPSVADIEAVISSALGTGDTSTLKTYATTIINASYAVDTATGPTPGLTTVAAKLSDVKLAIRNVYNKINDAVGKARTEALAYVPGHPVTVNIDDELSIIDGFPVLPTALACVPAIPSAVWLRYVAEGGKSIGNTESLEVISSKLGDADKCFRDDGQEDLANKISVVKSAVDKIVVKIRSAADPTGFWIPPEALPEDKPEPDLPFILAATQKKTFKTLGGMRSFDIGDYGIGDIKDRLELVDTSKEAIQRQIDGMKSRHANPDAIAKLEAFLRNRPAEHKTMSSDKPITIVEETTNSMRSTPIILIGAAALIGLIAWKFV